MPHHMMQVTWHLMCPATSSATTTKYSANPKGSHLCEMLNPCQAPKHPPSVHPTCMGLNGGWGVWTQGLTLLRANGQHKSFGAKGPRYTHGRPHL